MTIKVDSNLTKAIINGLHVWAIEDRKYNTIILVDEIDIPNPKYLLHTKMFVLEVGIENPRFYGVRFTRKPDGEIILAESDGMVTLIPLEQVKTYKLAK